MRLLSSLATAGLGVVAFVACTTSDAGTTTGDVTKTLDGGTGCAAATDCATGLCDVASGRCLPATAVDGRKNGTETDVDCGGAAAPACATGKACGTAGDCASAVCTLGVCQAPTSTDGVKNGAETDIDCGGAGNPKCVDTKACTGRDDCASDVCTGNVCVAPTDADGVKNGTETDVDCGGPTAKRCDAGLACNGADDCASKHCDTGGTGKCLAPTFSDGIQNGTETDIDCGGTAGHECATGKSCLAGTDCSSGGCNDKKLCAAGKSCTNPGGAGAYTCGTGGAGGSGAEAWEDCCTTIPVTTGAGTVKLDKYQTTSGRMRVFLESVGYDVRGFVKQARADGKIPTAPGNPTKSVLEPAWDAYLPTSFDGNANADELVDCDQGGYDTTYGQCCAFYAPTNGTCPQGGSLANGVCHYWNGSCPAGRDTRRPGVYTSVQNQLGGTIFRGNSQTQTGCFVGAPGTHTFRFPDGKQDGEAPEQPQSVYDTKSMTCANYLMAQAFCVWDGGRLETTAEWLTAYGAGTYPWSPGDVHGPQGIGTNSFNGCRFPTATNASHPDCSLYWNTAATSIDLTNYAYSYEYPALADTANDFVVFIAAPGRTLGRGPLGHADVIGNVFELTSTIDFPATPTPFNTVVHWSGNGSWEGHGWTKSPDTTYKYAMISKYGKTGFRCAKL